MVGAARRQLSVRVDRGAEAFKGIIRIEPSEEWRPKDNEPREIPISSELLPFLEPRRSGHRYLFTNRKGERYVFWPQRAFDRARKAAGVQEGCSDCRLTKDEAGEWIDAVACSKHGIEGGPHTTRHTFASHFLAGCPDLFLLAKILGHSTSYVTELYGHLLPDHLQRARNVVKFGLKSAEGQRLGR